MSMAGRNKWILVSQCVLFLALMMSIRISGIGWVTYTILAFFTLATLAASVKILRSDPVGSDSRLYFPKSLMGSSLGVCLVACMHAVYQITSGRPIELWLFLPGMSGLLLGLLIFWQVTNSTHQTENSK